MNTLTIDEFASKLENELMFYMPVQIQKTCTLQLKKSQNYFLQLIDDTTHLNEMPELDINQLYEKLQDEDIKLCFDKTMSEIAHSYAKEFELAKQMDKEKMAVLNEVMTIYPKDKIVFMAIKTPENNMAISENPHIRKDKLILLFSVFMENNENMFKTCTVTHEMMSRWGVTEKELFVDAKKNTPVYFPYEFEEISDIYYSNIYIVSNVQKTYGLSTIFYDAGPLKELAKDLDDNLYVFPLSVNEFIVFPENGEFTEADIKKMMQDNEILVDEIFYYNKLTDLLALNKLERLEQDAKMKRSVLDPAEKNIRGIKK